MKRTLRLVLSLLLSGVFLWVAFHNVDLAEVWRVLGGVSWPFIGLYLLAGVVNQFARTYRWDLLVRPFARLDRAALHRVSNLGLMLIFVLPLRLGEFARPYLMKREVGAPLSAGMGAVVVERVVDGLLVTALFFVTTLSLAGSAHVTPGLRLGGLIALVLFGGLFVAIVFMLVATRYFRSLTERLLKPFSPALAARALATVDAFVTGLRSLPDGRTIAGVIGLTIVYWMVSGVGFWCAMRGFGWDLPLSAGFTMVSVVVIGIMIPAGPGFLGTFQGAVLAALAIYGIGRNEATAYGLVVYPLNVLTCVAFGLPYLFTGTTRVRDIVGATPEST